MALILQMKNLSKRAASVDVRQFFRGLSIPNGGIHITDAEDGTAFINFDDKADLLTALRMTGRDIAGQPVELLLVTETEKRRKLEDIEKEKSFNTNSGEKFDTFKTQEYYVDNKREQYGALKLNERHDKDRKFERYNMDKFRGTQYYPDNGRNQSFARNEGDNSAPDFERQLKSGDYEDQRRKHPDKINLEDGSKFSVFMSGLAPHTLPEEIREFFGGLSLLIDKGKIVIRDDLKITQLKKQPKHKQQVAFVMFSDTKCFDMVMKLNGKQFSPRKPFSIYIKHIENDIFHKEKSMCETGYMSTKSTQQNQKKSKHDSSDFVSDSAPFDVRGDFESGRFQRSRYEPDMELEGVNKRDALRQYSSTALHSSSWIRDDDELYNRELRESPWQSSRARSPAYERGHLPRDSRSRSRSPIYQGERSNQTWNTDSGRGHRSDEEDDRPYKKDDRSYNKGDRTFDQDLEYRDREYGKSTYPRDDDRHGHEKHGSFPKFSSKRDIEDFEMVRETEPPTDKGKAYPDSEFDKEHVYIKGLYMTVTLKDIVDCFCQQNVDIREGDITLRPDLNEPGLFVAFIKFANYRKYERAFDVKPTMLGHRSRVLKCSKSLLYKFQVRSSQAAMKHVSDEVEYTERIKDKVEREETTESQETLVLPGGLWLCIRVFDHTVTIEHIKKFFGNQTPMISDIIIRRNRKWNVFAGFVRFDTLKSYKKSQNYGSNKLNKFTISISSLDKNLLEEYSINIEGGLREPGSNERSRRDDRRSRSRSYSRERSFSSGRRRSRPDSKSRSRSRSRTPSPPKRRSMGSTRDANPKKNKGFCLRVKNLPIWASETALNQFFAMCAILKDKTLVISSDGRASSGYIHCLSDSDVRKALSLDGTLFGENIITVEHLTDR